MIRQGRFFRRIGVAALAIFLSGSLWAATIDVTYVGTWDSTGSGNDSGMAPGQKYVIRIVYDDLSAVTSGVDVLDGGFLPSGNTMSTLSLQDAGNSLDIFVPMEGLDTGTQFTYTQDETNHFFYGTNTPVPTLNFVDGSSISDVSNIIGLEFEGDFVTGGGNNFIELFNTAPSGGSTNMVGQMLNFGSGIVSTDTNGLVTAVDVIVDAGADIVYDATMLDQTTSSSITQSNDLGAGRADGEDFLDASWSQTGTVSGNDVTVNIANSGLTTTTSTASWSLTVSEQMTLKSGTDATLVSYLNANPTISATETATATGSDFTLSFDDMDLMVNDIIAGFEVLTTEALVNGLITSFFDSLFATGSLSATNAELFAAFGVGTHTADFFVTDLAGGQGTSSVDFTVTDVVDPPIAVPEPETLTLLLLGIATLIVSQRRRKFA